MAYTALIWLSIKTWVFVLWLGSEVWFAVSAGVYRKNWQICFKKNTNPRVGIFISGGPTRTWTWDQRIPVCVSFLTPWTMPSPYTNRFVLRWVPSSLYTFKVFLLSLARRWHILRLSVHRIWHHSHSSFRYLVHNFRYESSALTNWAMGPT